MQTADLTAQLYFAAALRVGADASQTRLLPLANLREPLAPHDNFSQRILLALQALKFIEPELTLAHADDWLYARDWIHHGFASLGWRVLRPATAELSTYAQELITLVSSPESVDGTLDQMAALWEDLALAETAEYARMALARSGYDPRWADEAVPVLQQALAHFGASQVMYLVYISLRSIALTHQMAIVPITQLPHVLSNAIANYAQRAIAERWTIRGMVREANRPRSAIAAIFADTVIGLGPAYLAEPPSIDGLFRALVSRSTGYSHNTAL